MFREVELRLRGGSTGKTIYGYLAGPARGFAMICGSMPPQRTNGPGWQGRIPEQATYQANMAAWAFLRQRTPRGPEMERWGGRMPMETRGSLAGWAAGRRVS